MAKKETESPATPVLCAERACAYVSAKSEDIKGNEIRPHPADLE